MSDTAISFIGAGNMAQAIIGGLIAKGFSPAQITASDPFPDSLQRLQAIAPVRACEDNTSAVADADVVVLAVKPQVMPEVARNLAGALRARKPLVISIAAGITSASLQKWLGADIPVVRCMPNTPALIQTGATALFATPEVSASQKQRADDILSAVGIARWVDDEAQLDAVTALSGSGPAYLFLVAEAMQGAGEALGLAPDLAREFTLQTLLGAAQMAATGELEPAELRRRVTSPGGTTERAIASFEHDELRAMFERALKAARDRSVELARQSDD